jgi:HK97 family phage major capsid protein
LKKAVLPVPLPSGDPDNEVLPAPERKALDLKSAVRILRYGNIDGAMDLILREAYDAPDYLEMLDDQKAAFVRYLRTNDTSGKHLTRQLWPSDVIGRMLKDGMGMSEIKTTMVEGTDTLGGVAVPPDVAANILMRMKGLTAVREAGALVVQTASKMIEWLEITSTTTPSRYPSELRGVWGHETTSPSASNFTYGLKQIPVHVYTYKVRMSASLVEDASNLLPVFTQLVSDTLAIDEDAAFVTGDGANKPRGFLPSSANSDSLSAVNSGSGSTLTMDGLKALKRGVASQYRVNGRASILGNSATGLIIEKFTDGNDIYFYESLDAGQTKVMGATWRESEAMPDIAGSAFPLIYGDFSGYAIVERLGMAIQRYNDSYTGINVLEFHIRRRIGGKVIEPWKFAVQYISA